MGTFDATITPPAGHPATPGPVTRTLRRWVMRQARVTSVQALSPRFRLIDVEGDQLQGVDWLPGQKVQVAIGAGLSMRTYTPMSWDGGAGRMRLLAFLNGDGPGSRWAGDLREGESCEFLGPRRSLDLSGGEGPVVLLGDETSFALAVAMQGIRATDMVFEVSDAAESRNVLAAIGLARAKVLERLDGDAHLAGIGADLSCHIAGGARFVLTGKAQSIQAVSRVLKKNGMATSNLRSKAYWSPGKTGLD